MIHQVRAGAMMSDLMRVATVSAALYHRFLRMGRD
jgi:hypothetical protein